MRWLVCLLLFAAERSCALRATSRAHGRHTQASGKVALMTRLSLALGAKAGTTDPRPMPKNVGVVLLAGGKGKRMKAAMPKQFLPLLGKPVFLRSLDVFQSMSSVVSSIVIVLDESFRDEFAHVVAADPRIRWADPGAERQDSVFNGLQRVPDSCSVVAIHDAARPLVTVDEITRCLQDAIQYGAAVLGVQTKSTIKESEDGAFVLRTVPRSRLWEVHTPQVASKKLFLRGFNRVKAENLEVTDDVSVIEALGLPVKLTLGEYTNIKLTTPDDLSVAEQILRERGVKDESSAPEGGVGTSVVQSPIKTVAQQAGADAPRLTAPATATATAPVALAAPMQDKNKLVEFKTGWRPTTSGDGKRPEKFIGF